MYFLISLVSNRQIVLDKVDDEEDERREAKVHNSLTNDGVSKPVLPKGKKTIVTSREPTRKQPTEVRYEGFLVFGWCCYWCCYHLCC